MFLFINEVTVTLEEETPEPAEPVEEEPVVEEDSRVI